MLHMSTTVPMKQFMVCSLLILLVIAVRYYIYFVKEALRWIAKQHFQGLHKVHV